MSKNNRVSSSLTLTTHLQVPSEISLPPRVTEKHPGRKSAKTTTRRSAVSHRGKPPSASSVSQWSETLVFPSSHLRRLLACHQLHGRAGVALNCLRRSRLLACAPKKLPGRESVP